MPTFDPTMVAPPPIPVDSVAEEYAYLAAHPGPGGPWRLIEQHLTLAPPRDHLRVADPTGGEATFCFDISSFWGTPSGQPQLQPQSLGGETTAVVDRLLRTAAEFAQANGPHHPGSLPRFPVPSARYPGRIEVPMAVLAVEDGRRGLYAPPRVVVIDRASGEPTGVGEFPDFSPAAWPPPRLGDWPPPGIAGWDRERLAGALARLSACLVRLFAAWHDHPAAPPPVIDAAEVLTLLTHLDVPAMLPIYQTLNPAYWAWLTTRP